MPKKAAGDRTVFELFARAHPVEAAYLVQYHGGERIELQPFANKNWRAPNSDIDVRLYVEMEMASGVSYDRAVRKACKVFFAKASRVRAVVGPAPTPEEIQDDKEDEANAKYDKVRHGKNVVLVPRPTPTETILRRILTAMPHRSRNATIRMRRLLRDLNLDQIGDLPRLLGYGWGLRPIPMEKKRAIFARLSSYAPAGRVVARFLEAQANRDSHLSVRTADLLAVAEKKRALGWLIRASERQYESSDEFWWSFDEGLDTSKWKLHVDDEWDPRHQYVSQHLVNYMMGGSQYGGAFFALESFALSHPYRVLVIPTDPWTIPERNRGIREEFARRRGTGERISDVIDDLARTHFRSPKQIEEIVYGGQEGEPKNLHQEPGFAPPV